MTRRILLVALLVWIAADTKAFGQEEPTPEEIEYARAAQVWADAQPKCPSVPTSYRILDPGPAQQAFRAVTCQRGWSSGDTEAWLPFATSVMRRESKFCPSLFYGQSADDNCNVRGRARGSAAGFGQVIYSSNRFICGIAGLCSKWDIIASPTNSMTALVVLIEELGRRPWCYTQQLRNGSVCRSAPG